MPSASAAAITPDAGVARYLRPIAHALAEADVTADRVLRVAGALDAQPGPLEVRFRAPNALGRGLLLRDREDPARRPPEAVDFRPDPDGPPLRFADVAAELGAWRPVPGVTSPTFVYSVIFTEPAATVRALGRPTVEVTLDAVLSADPTDPAARVVRIGMRRDEID